MFKNKTLLEIQLSGFAQELQMAEQLEDSKNMIELSKARLKELRQLSETVKQLVYETNI